VVRWQSGKGGEGGKGWVSVWGSISGLLELLSIVVFLIGFVVFWLVPTTGRKKMGLGLGLRSVTEGLG